MPRLMRTVARTAVISGTATAVSGRVARRQSARFAQQAQAANPQPAPQAPPPPPPAVTDDVVDQIERLGKLREQGLLTDEEFAAQKAKLLA